MTQNQQEAHPRPRVGIYARVSTPAQADRETPIRSQLHVCRQVVGERFGRDASVREFVDKGYSGTLGLRKAPDQRSGFRPALTDLCEVIAAGEINVVVVQDRDRLARDEYVMLELVNDYFRRYNVRLFHPGGQIDLHSPEGLLIGNVIAAVAAFYPRQNIGKVKAGLAKRAAEGYPMTKVPYGWRWQEPQEISPGCRRGIERVEQEGVWVCKMKDWYLAGWGSAKIVRELNSQRVRGPGGGTWIMSTALKLLSNPLHAGLVRLPNDEGYISGQHSAQRYFQPEEFHEVQRIRARKSRKRGKYDSSRFILGGTAVCGECRRDLVGATHPTARFYQCSPHDEYDRRPCAGLTVRADHLEHTVVEHIKKLATSPDMQLLLGEQLEVLLAKQAESIRAELRLHQDALDEIGHTRDKMFTMLRRNQIPEHEYARRSKELDEEEAAVQDTSAELQARIENERLRESHVIRVRKVLANFDETWNMLTDDEKRRVVEIVVESILVFQHADGKKVVVKPCFLPEHPVIILGTCRANRPRFGLEALTMRQLAALALVDQGLQPKEIADRWQTSVGNVHTHLKNARDRLQVATTEEAVEKARPRIRQFRDYLPLDGRDGQPKGEVELTPGQQEVLKLMARLELKYAAIARKLGVTEGAVKYQAHEVMRRLGVNRRRQAVAKARKLGFLKEEHLPPAQTSA